MTPAYVQDFLLPLVLALSVVPGLLLLWVFYRIKKMEREDSEHFDSIYLDFLLEVCKLCAYALLIISLGHSVWSVADYLGLVSNNLH